MGRPTGLAWRLLGVVRLVHPFPSTLVAATIVLMGLVAARGAPSWPRLLAAGAAMLLVQFWVGVVNDLCDRDLDAATKPWKPLVAGRVPPPCAVALAVGLLLAAAALVVPLGAGPTALLGAVAVVALAYNVRLKRTRWSFLPYVAFFPLIPLYAWAASGRSLARYEPLCRDRRGGDGTGSERQVRQDADQFAAGDGSRRRRNRHDGRGGGRGGEEGDGDRAGKK